MNELMIFKNEEFGQVRTMEIDNKPYFVGKDIANILGYSNPRDAISRHCKGVVKTKYLKDGGHPIALISKQDVLRLIQTSKTKSTENKNKFKNWLVSTGLIEDKFIITSRKEIEFLDLLERTLEPFGCECIRQYNVLDKYKLDLYIKDLNIAIEYDENNHKNYTYEQHEGRQKEIENELGCKFIRVSDSESNAYNVGLVIKEICLKGMVA